MDVTFSRDCMNGQLFAIDLISALVKTVYVSRSFITVKKMLYIGTVVEVWETELGLGEAYSSLSE